MVNEGRTEKKLIEEIEELRRRLAELQSAFSEFRKDSEGLEKEMESISMELAISLFEVFEALKRISAGDPDVRISEESDIELIVQLKHMINLVAENIGEIVEQSHEFAMALAEQFDVLHRVTKGDLNARMTGESRGDLLDALKRVTNDMIGSIEREISRRRQMEEALAESEERYRRLFETSKDGLLLIDKKTCNIINTNPAIAELLGYSGEELIGRGLDDVSLLPHLESVRDIILKLEKMGFVHYYDVPIETKGGRSIDAEIYLVNRAKVIQCNIRDITERKRSDEALRKLYRAVEQSPTSVIITDLRGNIEYVNPKFTEITGYVSAEVLGKNPRILKSGETPAEEYRRMWDTITSGGEWHGVFHNKRKDGTLFWERASISPIRDSSGAITHFVAVKEDITTEKSLESQLLQAQKMEAIGQLAGGIAHDFNNILTAILGYGHLLKIKIKEDGPLRMYADQILSLSDKAANLTQNLLSFSRKRIANPQPVNLNEIIRQTDHLLSRIIGEDFHLQITLSGDDLVVMGDSGQIEQVLMNLATNARDAMSGGGVLTITTKAVNIDDAFLKEHATGRMGGHALITVSDTGAGMDRETKEKIFEPFFTTKGAGRGTGLGLSNVYGIIKQHEGYIDVSSEPGRGTTFRIYLPLTEAKIETAETEAAELVERGTGTVLLAEDEDATAEFMEKLIEEYGYKVIRAADGQNAVDKFKAHEKEVDLLLLDLIMPNKNGREAYDEITGMRPEVKVLFMSGYPADIVEKFNLIEKGFAYIEKPASPKRLLGKIREVLGNDS